MLYDTVLVDTHHHRTPIIIYLLKLMEIQHQE